ncbi:LysR substrate-binding domain-containing protein [Burkholderia cenocepacia]|nr:LysR substrate-binding domain-containing protein [Burkholderia cenocepacia]ONI93161.1 hypothetical protein A8F53_34615 [Burkholderia cenocepacia]
MGAVPLLTRALTDLRRRQPNLSVEIVEGTSASLLALIDDGRIDLAICRNGNSRRPEAYDYLPLKSEPLAVVTARTHALAGRDTLTLRDLTDAEWVAYPVNTPMRLALERALADAGIEVPRYPIETASTFATLTLLQADPELVAVIPREVAEFGERFGLIACLPVAIPALDEPYGVVARTFAHLSPGARLLVETLQGPLLT